MSAIATPDLDLRFRRASERRGVVLQNISWPMYEMLLRHLDGQHLSLTYDRGTLEIRPPSPRHEKIGKFIARFVETLTLELRIPIVALGRTTWNSQRMARGLEADECYYISRAAWAIGREEFDLAVDPPPDLAIEVDITSNTVDKEDVYRSLGVLELWRYEDGRLFIRTLTGAGRYESVTQSSNLPMLPPSVIESFVARRNALNDTALMMEFQEWVRANCRS